MGTALLNFGTRDNNIRHGTVYFSRVKANFSARVPKNLGGQRPPQEVVSARLKRGPRVETRDILVLRVFALMTVHENQSSGAENLVLFAGRKMASKNPKNSGTIRIWSNDATEMLIELRSEETIQFAIENSKISGNERGQYTARYG